MESPECWISRNSFILVIKVTCKHHHVIDCEGSTVELTQFFYCTVAFNIQGNVAHTEKASTSPSTNWKLLQVNLLVNHSAYTLAASDISTNEIQYCRQSLIYGSASKHALII